MLDEFKRRLDQANQSIDTASQASGLAAVTHLTGKVAAYMEIIELLEAEEHAAAPPCDAPEIEGVAC